MAEQTTVDPFADEASPEVAPVRAGEDLDWPRIANYLLIHNAMQLLA